jgi:hypothetical protein
VQQISMSGSTWSSSHYVGSPSAAGTYRLRASLPGVGEWSSALQSVQAPALVVRRWQGGSSNRELAVGHQLRTRSDCPTCSDGVLVERVVNGSAYAGSNALVVNILSADDNLVGVPAQVTIPAGDSRVAVPIEGRGLTATPVEVDAVAAGHSSPGEKLKVTVVSPALQFSSLDGTRGLQSARDNFNIYWDVPQPGGGSMSQYGVAGQSISIEIVEENPPGLIEGGIYAQQTGGQPVQQISMSGSTWSSSHYVGSPSVAGTYRLRANLPNVGEWLSSEQNVVTPSLGFSASQLRVGVGLRSNVGEIHVRRLADGVPANASVATPVHLECASTLICSVPPVTIAENSYQAAFTPYGRAVGSTVVSATAAGHLSGGDLHVEVLPAAFQLNSIEPIRVGQSRSSTLSTGFVYAGGFYTRAVHTPISVAVVSSNPNVITTATPVEFDASNKSLTFNAVGVGQAQITVSAPNFEPATITINVVN